jgi:hypothetical protein
MNANEMTFGIEIETHAGAQAIAAGLVVGGYGVGTQVPYLPAGWKASRDGSINAPAGRVSAEIVSPILKGEEGLRQVVEVVRALNAHGHQVNASCGVHVHVGFDPRLPAEKLARLMSAVSHLERALYAITGTKSRERGHYCGGIRKYGNVNEAKRNMDRSRYHLLNITNLASGRRPTVEFRVFSGSLNEVKIAGWVQVALGIVERALSTTRAPKWEPNARKLYAGTATSECLRLLQYLGWYFAPETTKHWGWLGNVVALKDVRKMFRRLAKKYDAEPAVA